MRALAMSTAAAVLALAGCADGGDDASNTARPNCATKDLYGTTLKVRVVGRPLPCSEVRRIVEGPCRDGRTWSCFSFRPPDPVLVWFREGERFNPGPDDFSTAIEARRPPCAESRVTAAAWRAAARDLYGFPTRMQVLADDIVRCRLLRGMTQPEVKRMLGPSGGLGDERRFLSYEVGPQRDSFIPVDSEFRSIEFGRDGRFKEASFYQG